MSKTNKVLGGGGFHHVAIRTKKFDESIKFYTGLLGCTLTTQWKTAPDRGALLDTGDGNYMEIFERPNEASGSADCTIFHIAFRCKDLVKVHASVIAAGYKETMAPRDIVIEGTPLKIPVKISFFDGPDGESIELFENSVS